MGWLKKLPGFERSASGLEWQIWRRLPIIAAVGTILPTALGVAICMFAPEASDTVQDRASMQFVYILIGVVVLHWTLVFTLAIGCVIVMLMKGPAFVADGYPMRESDRPASDKSAGQ